MNLVLDTNVLIAAFVARGICTSLVEHCLRVHTAAVSDFILNELYEKLVQKFKYATEDAISVVELLRSRMIVVIPVSLENPVCRDLDDDTILATAIAGNAVCIVTGDKDLLVLKRFASVDIISPSEFLDYEAAFLEKQR